MRILDRYVLRELLIPFGYCLGGFWIFWAAFDLFMELAEFQRNNCTASDVAQFYALRTPEMVVMVLPIAFLLALLYALTDMARHHELTAIRAAGVSLWRISVPYLGLGFVLSLVVFVLNEFYVASNAEAAQLLKHRRQAVANATDSKQWKRQWGFTNTRQNRIWYMDAYNLTTSEMLRPHVTWLLDGGTKCEIWAERGIYRDGAWVFYNVQENMFSITPGDFNSNITNIMTIPFSETPAQIRSEIKIGKISDLRDVNRTQLSIQEILGYLRLHPERSEKNPMLETKLQGRFATPWTCLVVVLIALPFGAPAGRRNVFVGVASSIVICFAYFVIVQLALALGTRGTLPPWLAAWAPNLLFGGTGVALTFRVR